VVASISSAEVERAFSQYKDLLKDNHRSLTEEHVKMLFFLKYNKLVSGEARGFKVGG
jgi:hypothetical protein